MGKQRKKRAADAKPILSPSQLETLSKCGLQWAFRYIDKIINPPTASMARGTGVHIASQANFEQKMETQTDMPAKDLIEIAVTGFESEVAGGITLDVDDAAACDTVIGYAKDEVVDATQFYAQHVAPLYQPIFVEKEIVIELPGERDLLMVLDVGTKDGFMDLKTAKKSKNQDEADNSLQLTAYAVGYMHEVGQWPQGINLETIVCTTKQVRRSIVTTTRDDDDIATLSFRIDAFSKAIAAGNFIPAPVGAWWCSPRWCGYWNICPAVRKGGRP